MGQAGSVPLGRPLGHIGTEGAKQGRDGIVIMGQAGERAFTARFNSEDSLPPAQHDGPMSKTSLCIALDAYLVHSATTS